MSAPIRNCAFSADPKMRGNGFAFFFKNLKFKGSSSLFLRYCLRILPTS